MIKEALLLTVIVLTIALTAQQDFIHVQIVHLSDGNNSHFLNVNQCNGMLVKNSLNGAFAIVISLISIHHLTLFHTMHCTQDLKE